MLIFYHELLRKSIVIYVLTLLAATEEMTADYADRPIITMAMAGLGSISRISCEIFGSCMTFGCGEAPSAPGQIGAGEI